ncbi:MAG: LAGLIDADG family homing endonuclease [archaeon]
MARNRVRLNDKYLVYLFRLVNDSPKYVSVNDLLIDLNCSRTSLKYFKRGKRTIPVDIFLRLLDYVPENEKSVLTSKAKYLPSTWSAVKGGIVSNSKLTKNQLKEKMTKVRSHIKSQQSTSLPSLNNLDACEFFGTMLGDGSLCTFKNEGRIRFDTRIAGNLKKDRIYLEYMVGLIKSLFNSKASLYPDKKQNCLQLSTRKKSIFDWLKSNGYPVGKKPKSFCMPSNIMKLHIKNKNRLIRGLLDTDGHINARKDEEYKYPYISITSCSDNLKKQLKELLRKQGFPAFIHADSVSVRGIKHFNRWFEVIGSSNPRILKKYEEFNNTGKIIPGS